MLSYKDFYDCETGNRIDDIIELGQYYFLLPYYMGLKVEWVGSVDRSSIISDIDVLGVSIYFFDKFQFLINFDKECKQFRCQTEVYKNYIVLSILGDVYYSVNIDKSRLYKSCIVDLVHICEEDLHLNFGFTNKLYRLYLDSLAERNSFRFLGEFYIFFLGYLCIIFNKSMIPMALAVCFGRTKIDHQPAIVVSDNIIYCGSYFSKYLLLRS